MWVEKVNTKQAHPATSSSSLWGCELKSLHPLPSIPQTCHPPCEDVSWKKSIDLRDDIPDPSSSLWGCELKNVNLTKQIRKKSHPPCEDVSWKNIDPHTFSALWCHPPCEDVSWKVNSVMFEKTCDCHPPCEDVSWKCLLPTSTYVQWSVILLVRMWVEKQMKQNFLRVRRRHPPCEDVSWKEF